jgi:DNA-binding NarL/FixJ family response regulator
VATVGANLAHGLSHGSVGALVSAWPALALVGSFELLMLLIRKHHQADIGPEADDAPDLAQVEPTVAQETPTLEQLVRDLLTTGHSQRSIARDLNIDRRKVKQIIDRKAA